MSCAMLGTSLLPLIHKRECFFFNILRCTLTGTLGRGGDERGRGRHAHKPRNAAPVERGFINEVKVTQKLYKIFFADVRSPWLR